MENTNEVIQNTEKIESDNKTVPEVINDLRDQISDSSPEPVITKEPAALELNNIITDEAYQTLSDAIGKMNIIEINKAVKELETEIKNIESAKDFADSIKNGSLGELSQKIAEANLASMSSLNKELTDFLASYDVAHERMVALSKLANEKLHSFDDVKKTTSYMTNSMLALIDEKMKIVESKKVDRNAPISRYYRVIHEVFANRTSVEYVLGRIPHVEVNIKRLKQSLRNKKEFDNIRRSTGDFITKTFRTSFSPEQLSAFVSYMTTLYDNSDAAYFAMYALTSIYSRASQYKLTGEHKWIDVLIMNVLDIITDDYDLEGGKEAYDIELLKIKDALGY
jgi:hypothetical protein